MAQNTAERLRQLAAPIAEGLGFSVWDTEFVKEGTEHYLRLYIDSEKGIGADDCEAVSNALSEPLDAADLVSHPYIFEVCSPGIERRLRLDWQFEKYIGEKVCIRCFTAVDGKKEQTGILVSYGDGVCVLSDGDRETVIEQKNISRAHTVFDF